MILIIIASLGIQVVYFIFIFSKLLFYKEAKKVNKHTRSTIIICYKNEAEVIEKTLPSILEQDFNELILVDDMSTDQTLDILQKYKSDRVKVISTQKVTNGKKHAQHTGISAAQNNSILLTDADCIPASKHWANIMLGMETSFVLGYGPMQKVAGLVGLFSRFETYMTAIQYLSYALKGIPYMGVGRNLKIDKSAFINKQQLIKGSHLASGDDDLLINAVSNVNNTSICIQPESFIYSMPKRTWSSFLKQKSRHISTSPYYKQSHKILLGLFSSTHILFYFGLIFGLLLGTISIKTSIILLLIKWVVQLSVHYGIMKKLKENDLFWKLPLLDVMFFLYLLVLPIFYLFYKKNKSWS